MIYLRTGQPGAGKTLFTLHEVVERAKRENRPVFYHGIEILKPELFENWQVLEDPKKWMECPDGAIIVHDECQSLYRPRGTGSAVPEYVQRFETHRHNGWDIYLITQHPMLVDSNIRRLAGEHSHVVSAFGPGMTTIHRWNQVKEQCDKQRTDSVASTHAHPKHFYNAYKSATIHTHKRRIPPRIYFLFALPLLLLALGYWFSTWYDKQSSGEVIHEGLTDVPKSARGESGQKVQRVKTTQDWLLDQQPRIAGLPHTAPVFDKVTEAVVAPVPAACVASATRCVCYSQQGTRLGTPDDLCRQIVQSGYFVAWNTSQSNENRTAAGATAPPAGAQQGLPPVGSDMTNSYIRDAGTYTGIRPAI